MGSYLNDVVRKISNLFVCTLSWIWFLASMNEIHLGENRKKSNRVSDTVSRLPNNYRGSSTKT